MLRRPPRSKRTDTLCPDTPLFRAGADVAGGLDLELVGRQSLHADRDLVAVAAGGIRVVAPADRAIPPRPGGMAPEQFGAGVLQLAVAGFALAAQPELGAVAADAGAKVTATGRDITRKSAPHNPSTYSA